MTSFMNDPLMKVVFGDLMKATVFFHTKRHHKTVIPETHKKGKLFVNYNNMIIPRS
jgi:hypothetical protein